MHDANAPVASVSDKESEFDLKRKEYELKVEAQLYDKWHKYESIAMHFNDLILRFRSQAIAGVAAISTLIVFLLSDKVSLQDKPLALWALSFLVVIIWIVIWIMDICYYQRLLIGAVDAILELEKQSNGKLIMSTKIESKFMSTSGERKMPWAPMIYYVAILFALLVGSGYLFYEAGKAQHWW